MISYWGPSGEVVPVPELRDSSWQEEKVVDFSKAWHNLGHQSIGDLESEGLREGLDLWDREC